MIEAPSIDTVKSILMNLKEIYEGFHKVIIDEEIIDLIIHLSNKYIYNRNEPDRSIDILDEVSAKVSLKENKNPEDLTTIEEIEEYINNIQDKHTKNILHHEKQDCNLWNSVLL